MLSRIRCLTLLCLTIAAATPLAAADPPAPTPPMREFRGAWIATVSNIDWPTSRFRTPAQARAELTARFDTAVDMNLNAIVLQVRPACDAFYPSEIEPWSRWLTGTQGTAPSPMWDPLQFAIDEARARGLEIHAWFNPYRARTTENYALAANHIVNTRPDIVRDYAGFKWLDPGHPDTQAYSLSVVMDVVSRYDIDAVHFDDYFYPYSDGTSFPDTTTYGAYQSGGGTLGVADWRRKNVNDFIQSVGQAIRDEKPHVRFGISPFGIWRPGNPAGIQGLDSYNSIYADSREWLRQGWVDYLAPQLYWRISPPQQSYTALLDWWISQNWQNRHVWPGIATYRLNATDDWPASEIVNQVSEARARPGARGTIVFSFKQLHSDTRNVRTELTNQVYQQKALIPTAPWMDDVPPEPPAITVAETPQGVVLEWLPEGEEEARQWVAYWYRNGAWEHIILPGHARSHVVPNSVAMPPTHVAVSSVDRLANESEVHVRPVQEPELPMTVGWQVF